MAAARTRNKIFNSIIEPLIRHLENSDYDAKSNTFVCLGSTVRTIWESTKIDACKYAVPEKRVAVFFERYDEIKGTEKPSAIQWRQFVITLIDVLEKIDCYKVDVVVASINKCSEYLRNLENTINPTYIKNWFKEFCTSLYDCLVCLQQRTNELSFVKTCEEINLLMSQLGKLLKLMYKLFVQEMKNQILITECRRFLVKCLEQCFDKLKTILHEETDRTATSNFIKWMDEALDAVALIEPNRDIHTNIENAKAPIEEVLCHAMSIAQICEDEDRKMIEAGVQSVLREFNNLKTECEKSTANSSVVNLYVDVVSDKLCAVEKRINTVLLKITLKVFSSDSVTLAKLRKRTEDSDRNILERGESDFEDVVTEFDTHVDCLLQVALFAVACSTDRNKIIQMRSCLASLEALESELVPSLTTLYMEPSRTAHLHASLFVNHWISEIEKLRDVIFSIIEPLAIGQVVVIKVTTTLEFLILSLRTPGVMLTKETLKPVHKNVRVLLAVIKANIHEIHPDSDLMKIYRHLKDIHKEVVSSSKILLEDPDRIRGERVLKRCKILQNMLARLIEELTRLDTTQQATAERNPETEVKADIDMTDLKAKGHQLLKERSVLYKTPMKTVNRTQLKSSIKPANVSTRINESRRPGMSFARKLTMNFDTEASSSQTMNLDITDILEDITNFMDTLE